MNGVPATTSASQVGCGSAVSRARSGPRVGKGSARTCAGRNATSWAPSAPTCWWVPGSDVIVAPGGGSDQPGSRQRRGLRRQERRSHQAWPRGRCGVGRERTGRPGGRGGQQPAHGRIRPGSPGRRRRRDRSWGGPGADVLYGNSGSDHVSQVKPSIIGADLLSGRGDQGPAPQRFDQAGGAKLILSVRPSQIFLQENELARGGHSLADVARYMRTLKTGAIAKSAVPPGERNKDAFDAAIPAPWLRQLPCVPGP
jgi:hypothetical protein